MTKAFFLSLSDLFDGRILAIMLRVLLISLAIFLAIGLLLGIALTGTNPCGDYGYCELSGWMSGLGAALFMFLALWFLYPAVAFGVMWAYADRIIALVEDRHYPAAAASAKAQGIGRLTKLGLLSAGRLILLNLIALPFYILLLVTGIGTIILFVLVNGIAFGRDLGEMVSARHGDAAARRVWLRETRGSRLAIGMSVAALVLVPLANLIAPALGAIMATHLYHRERPIAA